MQITISGRVVDCRSRIRPSPRVGLNRLDTSGGRSPTWSCISRISCHSKGARKTPGSASTLALTRTRRCRLYRPGALDSPTFFKGQRGFPKVFSCRFISHCRSFIRSGNHCYLPYVRKNKMPLASLFAHSLTGRFSCRPSFWSSAKYLRHLISVLCTVLVPGSNCRLATTPSRGVVEFGQASRRSSTRPWN